VKHMAETSVLCHSSDSNIMDFVTIVTGTKDSTTEDTERPLEKVRNVQRY